MISVIIPNYQTEKKLFLSCIKSIIKEKHLMYEIIIIDDGNSEEYRKDVYSNPIFINEKIRLIFQENQGVSAARNKGIAEANGYYLTFIDADDFIIGDFLSESVNIGLKYKADIVFGAMISARYYNQETLKKENNIVSVFLEQDRNMIKEMLIGKHYYIENTKAYIGRGPVAKIFRTKIAKQINFDVSLQIYEDTTWNLDFVENSYVFCRVDKIWYGYNYVNDSASKGFHHDEIERSTKGMIEVFKRLDIAQSNLQNAFFEQCLLEYSRIMESYFLNKKNKKNIINKIMLSDRLIRSCPWNYLLGKRFDSLEKKMRIRAKLYTHNLWLPIKILTYNLNNLRGKGI